MNSLPTFVLIGRPCVDCHAFEFMQRALQDLKKTAFNLDSRVRSETFETLKPLNAVSGMKVMSLY